MRHLETHRTHRVGWLRAAVLGANDGIVSTASLILGVAAAGAARGDVLTAGIAGLVAGSMSMAAGEYVSVSSQKDAEQADLHRERAELEDAPASEHRELASIYRGRGVDSETANRVAEQMMAHDALAAHARDELGISDLSAARPTLAAGASAATFAVGAGLPLVVVTLAPPATLMPFVALSSLVFLVALGVLAARAGGASPSIGAARVALWGLFAMALTAAAGHFFSAAA